MTVKWHRVCNYARTNSCLDAYLYNLLQGTCFRRGVGLDGVLRLPSNPCNCVQFYAKDSLQKAILEELICESIFFPPNVLNVNALKKACNQLIKSSLQFYILTTFVNWMSFSDLMINLQTNQTENGLEKNQCKKTLLAFPINISPLETTEIISLSCAVHHYMQLKYFLQKIQT